MITGLWDLGESVIISLENISWLEVAITTKINSKCLYMYVGKLLIARVLDCRGTRKTADTHDFVI